MNIKAMLTITCFIVCMFILGCKDKSENSEQRFNSENPVPNYKVQGPMKVYYHYQTSDTSGVSTLKNPAEVDEILFFDRYIIIQENNSSLFIAVDKIKRLRWIKDPTPPTSKPE